MKGGGPRVQRTYDEQVQEVRYCTLSLSTNGQHKDKEVE